MENKKEFEELLREQMKLLAERSKDALPEELPSLSRAMVEIYQSLKP